MVEVVEKLGNVLASWMIRVRTGDALQDFTLKASVSTSPLPSRPCVLGEPNGTVYTPAQFTNDFVAILEQVSKFDGMKAPRAIPFNGLLV
ncbi:MAG: hypothetical protein Q9183_003670 [Haloplaca sp. 2 TL-2023]